MTLPKIPKINLAFSKKSVAIVVGVLVVITIIVLLFIQNNRSQKEISRLKTQVVATEQQEAQTLVTLVGKLVELPTDETPTIATVTDKEKLSGQSFFSRSENGDRLLIYPKIRKVYLYRPSINKLIDIAPISLDQTTPTPQVKK
jgi:hypothetical protein